MINILPIPSIRTCRRSPHNSSFSCFNPAVHRLIDARRQPVCRYSLIEIGIRTYSNSTRIFWIKLNKRIISLSIQRFDFITCWNELAINHWQWTGNSLLTMTVLLTASRPLLSRYVRSKGQFDWVKPRIESMMNRRKSTRRDLPD